MRDGLGNGAVPSDTAGEGAGWARAGPCHKQRLLRFAVPEDASTSACEGGALLLAAATQLLHSSAFAKWLLKITDLTVLVPLIS